MANYQTMPVSEIAAAINMPYTRIHEFLRRRGLYANRFTTRRWNIHQTIGMTATEFAYLAGIIDGEGTISVRRNQRSTGRVYFQPHITVANTSFRLLQWLRDKGFSSHWYVNNGGHSCYKIYWSGYQMGGLLSSIRPYLVIKAPHADLVLELIEIRGKQRLHEPLPERCFEIVQTLRALNHRGSGIHKELSQYGLSTTSLPKNNLLSQMDF